KQRVNRSACQHVGASAGRQAGARGSGHGSTGIGNQLAGLSAGRRVGGSACQPASFPASLLILPSSFLPSSIPFLHSFPPPFLQSSPPFLPSSIPPVLHRRGTAVLSPPSYLLSEESMIEML